MVDSRPNIYPPNDGTAIVITTYAAGHRVKIFPSTVKRWVAAGWIRGGSYEVPGGRRIWWLDRNDLDACKREGGGIIQVGVKRRWMAERAAKEARGSA